MPAPVTIVPTPNPDALMFRVQEILVPMGTFEYKRGDDTTDAPLAHALMAFDDIELILIAPRFVTGRKHTDSRWSELELDVETALIDFLGSGEMAVFESLEAAPNHDEYSEIDRQILELLDEEIRPAIAQDGGDVAFEGFKDGVVYLRLEGSCGTCPSSVTTLKMGIERLLVEEIEAVTRVESVDPLPEGPAQNM